MSFYFWLGHNAEAFELRERDMAFFRREIHEHFAKCKPEADGWITLHPKVKQ